MYNDPVPDPDNYLPPSRTSPPIRTRQQPSGTTRECTIPTPSIMCIRLLLIVTQVPAHASDDSNNNPTTNNHPQGAANMPITTQDQAAALVQILHTIRATRSHGTADWHPKAIEKTLYENRTHPAHYGDIVVALTKYARDSDKRVPSFMWDALADWAPAGQTAPRTPCEDHGFPAHNCHSCKADILVGDRPPEYMGKHYDIPMTGPE